jgi:hypothetical protein
VGEGLGADEGGFFAEASEKLGASSVRLTCLTRLK